MSNYPLIGITLQNRYKIVQLLGSGGFGDTYLAVDLDLPGQPQCVVKHLKPKNPDPAILALGKERFEREAQTLYRLGNENNQIPRLFAYLSATNPIFPSTAFTFTFSADSPSLATTIWWKSSKQSSVTNHHPNPNHCYLLP